MNTRNREKNREGRPKKKEKNIWKEILIRVAPGRSECFLFFILWYWGLNSEAPNH